MKVLIVRHGIAEALENVASGNDSDRPLTEEGKQKMKEIGGGLKKLGIKPDAIWTSPLLRARETTDCLVEVLAGKPDVAVEPGLSPGEDDHVIFQALAKTKAGVVALVGHEPSLSRLASRMLVGNTSANILMKKGAVCCIEFEDKPNAGGGLLEWLMQPKALRSLARE